MNRNLFYIILIACLSAFGSQAATVSGTVTNTSTSAVVSGQKVYLYDSVVSVGTSVIDSGFTNSSGIYSFTVSSSITSGLFYISATACGNTNYAGTIPYSGSNLTINLNVCNPIGVFGYLSYSNSTLATGMKVYLVDSSSAGITYKDSTTTDVTGLYVFMVPSTVNRYFVYVNACGARWNSAGYFYSAGGRGINMTLGCSSGGSWGIVYDTVKNSTTGLPVFGQKVYLLDSTATATRLDSSVTNRYGVAYFYVPPAVTGGPMRVFTNACGVQSQSFHYIGTSMAAPTLPVCLSNTVISGTVTNTATSSPVAGQLVTVTDSLGTALVFWDTSRTNASGFYSVAVPIYAPATGTMIASVQACGSVNSATGTYSGSNMTLNLGICATNTATISGVVTIFATGAPAAGRKVYLLDSTATSVTRDSAVTNASGAYSFSIPASVFSAFYLIWTPSCGTNSVQGAWYTGLSLVHNFSVCSTTGASMVSGTIVDPTGTPAAGVNVSLGSVTVTTGSTGTYSLAIPSYWSLGAPIMLYASNGCGSFADTIFHTGVNVTRLDTIFNNFCHTIGGTVSKQGGGAAASAKVYLIIHFYDTSTTPPSAILWAWDSTLTNASGQYSFTRNFAPSYLLHIKAALQPSDPAYSAYLPTYHDSSLIWSGADTITSATWLSNASNLNVSLRGGTNPGGPGFIGGNVLVGANKNSGVGDPLAQRVLLLTDAADKAIGYTYSDAAGAFSFPNLAFGSYKIFGDAGGKANPPLSITLSATQPRIEYVLFEENDRSFSGSVPTGTGRGQSLTGLRVFPNPATDMVQISGLSAIPGDKHLVLTNLTGAVISTLDVTTGDVAAIPVTTLPAGLYLLRVSTENGTASYKVVK